MKYTCKSCGKSLDGKPTGDDCWNCQTDNMPFLKNYNPMKEVYELVVKARELKEKHCKHDTGSKLVEDNIGSYHVEGDFCIKCGMSAMDFDRDIENEFCACGNEKMNNSEYCSECI